MTYESMIVETIKINGHNSDAINAYTARPMGKGPFPGVVLIHHLPGWDETYREFTRRFAHKPGACERMDELRGRYNSCWS